MEWTELQGALRVSGEFPTLEESSARDALLKSFQTVCSCGAKSIIFFDPDIHDFRAVEPSWVFTHMPELDPSANEDEWFRGWNCGQLDHFQMPTEPGEAPYPRYVWDVPYDDPSMFPELIILADQLERGFPL